MRPVRHRQRLGAQALAVVPAFSRNRDGLCMRPSSVVRRSLPQPERVDLGMLAQFPGAWRVSLPPPPDGRRRAIRAITDAAFFDAVSVHEATPQERIAYRELRVALTAELLDSIHDQDPASASASCCAPGHRVTLTGHLHAGLPQRLLRRRRCVRDVERFNACRTSEACSRATSPSMRPPAPGACGSGKPAMRK